ncbi:MAG: Verru_Chthon cassette protein B [Verrucomicrobia bacterium]|nr:Verru_Chthon cassette protein B [Verrucomicrobiota bacterium]
MKRFFIRKTGSGGFSLIEVLIAVGIGVVAVTTLFALLPAGLSSFRESMNISVTSQIGQRLLKEASQSDFAVLTAEPLTKPWRYYDDGGVELPSAEGAVFYALVHVQTSAAASDDKSGIPLRHMATVMVQVVLNSGNRPITLLDGSAGSSPPAGTIDPKFELPFTTFVSHVARML